MRTREKAVALIIKQLESGTQFSRTPSSNHYGKCELRELMDYIYESLPVNDEQRIDGEPWINNGDGK